MFQINWKLKSFFYKVFGLLELKSTFYLIQKYITHRSKVKIDNIDKSWTLHLNSIKENNLNNLLELGAGKSLEQNIYFSYALNNKLDQIDKLDKQLNCYKIRKEFMKCYLQKDIEYCKKKYNNLIKKCIAYYN